MHCRKHTIALIYAGDIRETTAIIVGNGTNHPSKCVRCGRAPGNDTADDGDDDSEWSRKPHSIYDEEHRA